MKHTGANVNFTWYLRRFGQNFDLDRNSWAQLWLLAIERIPVLLMFIMVGGSNGQSQSGEKERKTQKYYCLDFLYKFILHKKIILFLAEFLVDTEHEQKCSLIIIIFIIISPSWWHAPNMKWFPGCAIFLFLFFIPALNSFSADMEFFLTRSLAAPFLCSRAQKSEFSDPLKTRLLLVSFSYPLILFLWEIFF